jgi:hypothetical protein
MLRRACLLLSLALPALLPAKVYYVNQGVKYHLGDGHASRSVDAEFLDAYPVVGPRWVQAFTVDRPDTVHVKIDHLWGVDDCEYCKDMVYIDDIPIARFFEEDDEKEFSTPSPTAIHCVPGHVYKLRVESFALNGQLDDFAFEGVSVLTDQAGVTLLEPGPVVLQAEQPMPVFREPKPIVGPCNEAQPIAPWLPDAYRSRGSMGWASPKRPQSRRLASELGPGQFAKVYAKVESSAPGNAVEQFLELQVGEPDSGWVISFGGQSKKPYHGNVRERGHYRGKGFSTDAWKAGEWNELMLARCADGSAHLWINGTAVPVTLGISGNAFRLRSAGLNCVVSPQKY